MKKCIALVILLVLAFSACNAVPAGEYRKISPAIAGDMMHNLENYIILDVRSEEEFAAGHIADAQLLPEDKIAVRAAAELPDKDAVILVYCQSGRRSELAANALCKLGYSNVYDFGGINDWPYETVSIEE